MRSARQWFILKPIAHNKPIDSSTAVFEEFKPTVTPQDCEWIKVLSADDLENTGMIGVSPAQFMEKVRALESKLAKAVGLIGAWNEYFSAIKNGEYETNGRAKRIRVFEQVLIDEGQGIIKTLKEIGD